MRAVRTIAVLIGFAVLAVRPAGAATVVDELVTNDHWRAVEIASDGSPFTLRWDLAPARDPIQIGSWFFRKDRSFVGGFDYTSFAYQNDVHAEANVIPGSPIIVDHDGEAHDFPLSVRTTNILQGTAENPQTYVAVFWFQGDIAAGVRFRIEAGDGVTFGSSTSGDNLALRLSNDFDGPVEARIQGTVPRIPGVVPNGIGPGAQASVLGTTPFVVSGDVAIGRWSRLGQGSPFGAQARAMSVTSDAGTTRDCTPTDCFFYGVAGAEALAPGRYTFTQSGAGAGIGPFGDSMLTLVDIRFP